MSKSSFSRLWKPVLIAAGSFMGGMVGVCTQSLWMPAVEAQSPVSRTIPGVPDPQALGERFNQVARQVLPAVAAIEARKTLDKPGGGKRQVEETGSGIIVKFDRRPEYFLLTNNHVISGSELNQITIQLADGRLLRPMQVWADPKTDVAVLRLEAPEPLPTAPLGDSDSMQVGHWVLAMGSPFGLNQTVTHGIISAVGRGQVSLGSTILIKDFLQTDAAINPGSSGGPLINMQGEVIGINTAIASPGGVSISSGVAFSIPINLYRRIALELLERGRIARGFIGLQVAGGLDTAQALKLGLDRGIGALVDVVYADSPAARAGIKPGDVILEVDQQPVRHENHFINLIAATAPGRTVTLTVWRERRRLSFPVVVEDRQQHESRFSR
ncbi:MAG TPA: trypsin-like peptidase domain-containing protein [Gemmatales bacterium]|nr:trypsin-like peptidase domain-containing protein [Gemmatales bacterium]